MEQKILRYTLHLSKNNVNSVQPLTQYGMLFEFCSITVSTQNTCSSSFNIFPIKHHSMSIVYRSGTDLFVQNYESSLFLAIIVTGCIILLMDYFNNHDNSVIVSCLCMRHIRGWSDASKQPFCIALSETHFLSLAVVYFINFIKYKTQDAFLRNSYFLSTSLVLLSVFNQQGRQ